MSLRLKLAVVAGLVAALLPALWHLADFGRTNEYAGHAMFVPLFSALMAWNDRDRLRAAAERGHVGGAALLAVGLALAWVGTTRKLESVEALAITASVAGAVLWLFGAPCLRAAAFPIGFLIMTAPLPQGFVAAVTTELQGFAAGFAATALQLIGVPVYHVGATLELSQMTLQVAEVCNGLRFLMAIIVLTAAFAQIMLPTWPRKVTLVLSTIPIAILANAVRVAAIGVGVHYVGPEAASGTIHDWIGKGVWAITLLPMIAVGLTLARFRRPSTRRDDQVAAVPAANTEAAR